MFSTTTFYTEISNIIKFYDVEESEKYARSSRMLKIQTTMTERCLELLQIDPELKPLVLDIG